MALDNAQFISELSITDPPGTDPLSEGDDQIRTVKRATQQSFPNVDAQVTLSAAELNDVALKSAANTFALRQTFTSGLELPNAQQIFMQTFSAVPLPVMFLSASDVFTLGEGNINLALRMNTLGDVVVGGVTVASFLGLTDGGMTVRDIDGSARKVAFRNPRTITIFGSRALVQADEQRILSISATSLSMTVDQLEAGTQIDITSFSGSFTLVQGTASINWYDGAGAQPLSGTRQIARGSVIHLNWNLNNFVDLWGNGIT